MASFRQLFGKIDKARMIVIAFFLFLCVMAVAYDVPVAMTATDVLVRYGMNIILVLSMVPGIACGIGLNFGLPISIVCGILGGLIALEIGLTGALAFIVGILISIPISIVAGIVYGILLNKVKGAEMMVETYVGFSIISLMCIAWVSLPFKNEELIWPIGKGLRQTIDISGQYGGILDKFLQIKIGEHFIFPTGLLLFALLMCFIVWIFFKTKTGVMMKAAGENPEFARANGINVDRYRILGTVFSTILGAVGIIVYAQSFGFYQLYQAPMMMGFAAVAAILIGGATARTAKISHVLIGTFLFQGILTIAMPVANKVAPDGNLAEIVRILVSNGIIVYALTKGKRGE